MARLEIDGRPPAHEQPEGRPLGPEGRPLGRQQAEGRPLGQGQPDERLAGPEQEQEDLGEQREAGDRAEAAARTAQRLAAVLRPATNPRPDTGDQPDPGPHPDAAQGLAAGERPETGERAEHEVRVGQEAKRRQETEAARKRARPQANEWLILGALFVLAALIRFVCRHYVTSDMVVFYQWSDQLKAAGGIHGLKQPIGNYNAPFLYLLLAALYLPGATLLKIKAIFVLFDVLLVYFVYRLVGLKYRGWRVPTLAALVVAFLPTVVVNASMYGQCDSIWVAFSIGGVYYLLRDKQWLGVSLIAVAIAFKPQGVFILPVLLLLVLGGRAKWKTLLALPVVYVALDLPAILLGRSPRELLTIYTQQLDDSNKLARSGPSVYHYLPVTVGTDVLRHLGYLFTAVLVLGVCYVLVATKTKLDAARVLTAAGCFAILLPFLLPGMHERYFYLADVLTVVVAFYRPRLWYLPLIIQASSALAYAPFLFRGGPQGTFVDIKTLTTMMLAGILISGYALLHDVRTKTADEA